MKFIIYITMFIFISSLIYAVEQNTATETIITQWGSGGLHEDDGDDEQIASMYGQGAIGHIEQDEATLGVGLFYLALLNNVLGVAPAVPAAALILTIKDMGIEWISVNWTI